MRRSSASHQALPDVDYGAFAASLGLLAIHVDKPAGIGTAWDQALAADRPAVLDVRCDPDTGDEDARGVVLEGIKTKIQEFLPHRDG